MSTSWTFKSKSSGGGWWVDKELIARRRENAAGGSTADQEDAGTNYSSINCGAGETSPHKDAKAIGPLQPIDELSVTGSVRRRV